MARLINVVEGQSITCDVTTIFTDGSTSVRTLAVGEVVEGLRYVQDHEVKTVSGRVSAINTTCSNVTTVSGSNPVDYFSQDVIPSTIEIDASEQYASNVVIVPAREIVEDEGVQNVSMVTTARFPRVTLEMSYTSGEIVHQDVVVGDVLCDMRIMTAPRQPDIVGDFRVAAFVYRIYNKKVSILGLYLTSLETGACVTALFNDIICFTEKPVSNVTESDSLSQIASALSENDEVFAFLDTDVTIPAREDGRITSLFVNEGKILTVDLSGHNLDTQAYAFYVNGGTLNIRDAKGEGRITACYENAAYPVVQVTAGGVCNMEGGIIDTTTFETSEGHDNWLYGVVCSGDGIFNMTGGQIITQDAAGISITNGTATGEGAQFNIGGDAILTSRDCTAIYLADNKVVNITDDAVINGGILVRLGDIKVSGKAIINSVPAGTAVYPLGRLVCESGCENHNAAILAMTGCYNSALGNDLNIEITGSAKVNGAIDNAIDIATLNTKYDQTVNVTVVSSANMSYINKLWNIYNHDQLAAMATAQGKTLPAETTHTTLTIKVDNAVVYP